ncbi:FecR family protein [Paraflavitalea pollutisoli]|uniref:FecR family protein n=1 Tax=Paraflavitalea pollutisoli TaxID=3034143 RepID=UPI0023ED2210|nr:FecR family protein [Paraflavitalea sp. H1-2-19X]
MEKVEYIAGLILKHRAQTLTNEERNELERWLNESEENRSLLQELTDNKTLIDRLRVYNQIDGDAVWQKTMQHIAQEGSLIPLHPPKSVWWKYAAAAAVVLTVSVVGWQYLRPVNQEATAGNLPVNAANNDILPGGLKATLTLADGKQIDLDQVADQSVIKEGNVLVMRKGGQLTYSGSSLPGSAVLYNTVTTPKGGKFQVKLPDGSIVWLNAASSLRFPIAFAGNERKVSLTGEAFFEVSRMTDKPFRVSVTTPLGDGGTVEVLGTHFNIDAYSDVALMKTTLVEGSVKLTTPTAEQQILQPMQTAVVNRKGILDGIEAADATKPVPWVEDLISLEGNIKSVLLEIGRWYNLTVEFKGKIPEQSLKGKIPRTMSIDELEKLLKSQGLKFELLRKERKIVLI